MNDIDELILSYLNDVACDADIDRLFDWVHQKPENATEFARICALHADLRIEFHGKQLLQPNLDPLPSVEHPIISLADPPSSARTNWQSRIADANRFLIAAALLLMLQASWGALTLVELCQVPTNIVERVTTIDVTSP